MSDRMSEQSLQTRRIARLLGVESTDLDYLRDVPEDELKVLHDQVARAVFAGGEKRMAKVAGLSRSIPAPLAGRLAERFLPPLVAARVAELLEPERARDLVGRVSVPYLADLAVALDPVRSRPVVRAIPPQRIGEVAGELFARGEHALMAEFVTSVERPALEAALAVASPRDLLTVLPLLEWTDDVEHVVEHLPVARVREIAAALTPSELADLVVVLGPSRCEPLLEAVDDATVAAVGAQLVGRRDDADLETIGSLAWLLSDDQLERVTALVDDDSLVWLEGR
ncbi:hypothetical protein GCM10023226_09850 [Nocardioides nanhaiensis]|uniref:Magnesium transporter MgtE intracellular domain-containing protein n=2 Tax=Nocardioides nanhaiensis TaxID=1476871 RepID=A0ABP8VWK4_9ACTN